MTGTLYLRDLIELDPKKLKVGDVMDRDVLYVKGDQTLDHALSAFLKTKHHLFVVIDEKEKTLGVVTIEDIVDEVIGRKFEDRFNQHDNRRAVARITGEVE
jgi:putative hemolysin